MIYGNTASSTPIPTYWRAGDQLQDVEDNAALKWPAYCDTRIRCHQHLDRILNLLHVVHGQVTANFSLKSGSSVLQTTCKDIHVYLRPYSKMLLISYWPVAFGIDPNCVGAVVHIATKTRRMLLARLEHLTFTTPDHQDLENQMLNYESL